jgi:hypothetical protein
MTQGRLLAGLIVVATALFVLGSALERNGESGEPGHHDEATTVRSTAAQESGSGEAGETPAEHAGERGEGGAAATTSPENTHEELRPLGIDIEAWPFIALAALASLALAAATWLRPHTPGLLALVAAAMLLFAALDVREVVHQLDIDKTGLAVLAGAIAVLHLLAAVLAGVMASRSWRPASGPPSAAGTMPA